MHVLLRFCLLCLFPWKVLFVKPISDVKSTVRSGQPSFMAVFIVTVIAKLLDLDAVVFSVAEYCWSGFLTMFVATVRDAGKLGSAIYLNHYPLYCCVFHYFKYLTVSACSIQDSLNES